MSTPTKAAEIIREALELAMARIGCPPGDNADADIYHRLSRALALLADMEREGEPVAWNDGDIEAAYLAGCINGASQEATGKTYWPSLDRVQAELQRLKDNGIAIPSMIRSMRNKAHPSPTAADAKDSPVDVQEVIRAGDELTKIKGALCNFILSLAPRDRDGHFTKDELDRMTTQWTNATKPFRP